MRFLFETAQSTLSWSCRKILSFFRQTNVEKILMLDWEFQSPDIRFSSAWHDGNLFWKWNCIAANPSPNDCCDRWRVPRSDHSWTEEVYERCTTKVTPPEQFQIGSYFHKLPKKNAATFLRTWFREERTNFYFFSAERRTDFFAVAKLWFCHIF